MSRELYNTGLRASNLGFRGLGLRGLGFRVWGSRGFRGLELIWFRVWGLGFTVWGLGFRAWGSGCRTEPGALEFELHPTPPHPEGRKPEIRALNRGSISQAPNRKLYFLQITRPAFKEVESNCGHRKKTEVLSMAFCHGPFVPQVEWRLANSKPNPGLEP